MSKTSTKTDSWSSNWKPPNSIVGLHGGSDGKESTCNAGDPGLLPGMGRSPGEGNGNPLQYSCLENPMDRRAWQGLKRVGYNWVTNTLIASKPLTNRLRKPCFPGSKSTTSLIIPQVLIISFHKRLRSDIKDCAFSWFLGSLTLTVMSENTGHVTLLFYCFYKNALCYFKDIFIFHTSRITKSYSSFP